jgi:hypothetical protein
MTGKAGGWDWDGYQGWGQGEPASTGPTRLSPLFGPGGGTPFNDYSTDLAAIDTITVGYRAGSIDAIQVRPLFASRCRPLRGDSLLRILL